MQIKFVRVEDLLGFLLAQKEEKNDSNDKYQQIIENRNKEYENEKKGKQNEFLFC